MITPKGSAPSLLLRLPLSAHDTSLDDRYAPTRAPAPAPPTDVRLTTPPATSYREFNRLAGVGEMADDDWDKEMERLDERTAKRRAKAKEQDEKAQELIREAEERRDRNTPAE